VVMARPDAGEKGRVTDIRILQRRYIRSIGGCSTKYWYISLSLAMNAFVARCQHRAPLFLLLQYDSRRTIRGL
jgi:hypothetical protein